MSKKTYELLFKGFIKTKNKKSIEKIKGRTDFKTFDDIKDEPEFGGIFNDGIIMVDVDDSDQAEVLYKIVNDLNINCVVIQTGRGKHFYFRNNEVKSNKNRTNTAISIVADMKMGQTSYGVIKWMVNLETS